MRYWDGGRWTGYVTGAAGAAGPSGEVTLPLHAGFVGHGMLDAACPGDVFAAPPMDYVLETSKLLASPKGVLHIVNNYTGDRMAFDMGKEMAEADGITIGTLLVDDDVAVKDSTYTVGRRGVAGNFFVIKAVGAASERGAELDDLLRIGNKVNSVTRTMGMALTSCTPPAKGSPLFDLGDDEMEMGVGIHGEPGRRREKMTNANAIIDELLEAVASDLPYGSGDEVALMINGLGGTPISELYILYGRAHDQLAQRGINVTRSYVGEYCTSLDMAGASLTLVKLDSELNELFDAPADVHRASGGDQRSADRARVGDDERRLRPGGDARQRPAGAQHLGADRLPSGEGELRVPVLEGGEQLGAVTGQHRLRAPLPLPTGRLDEVVDDHRLAPDRRAGDRRGLTGSQERRAPDGGDAACPRLDREMSGLPLAQLRERRVAPAQDQAVGVVSGLPVSGEEQGHTGHMRIVTHVG